MMALLAVDAGVGRKAGGVTMRLTLFNWLDHEFVALSGEGAPGLGAGEATRELLGRFAAVLGTHGLSLDDTVRTRLFTTDRPGRDQGSGVRRERLSGQARSVSSSFIAPRLFDSPATVALDLLAMRLSQAGAAKTLVEYEPPRAPLRYLTWESAVFLSGVTCTQGALAEQVATIQAEHGETLSMAGSGWDRVALVSCFLHSSQDVGALRQALAGTVPAAARVEVELVEGFASEGCLIEIELTARG
jgi:enamine deaminase RidA (YjgF/YER057c/UK114 family)